MKLSFHSAESRRVRAHFKLLGLEETQMNSMLLQIHKWEEENGHEWVVTRLKSYKTWFVQHLAGNTSFKVDWIGFKTFQNRTIPKGPFGTFFCDDYFQNSKKTVKALSALMVYTAYKLRRVSRSQIRKTLGSIQGEPLDDSKARSILKSGETLVKGYDDVLTPLVRKFQSRKQQGFNFNPVSLNTGKPFATSGEKYLTSFLNGLRVSVVRQYLIENFGMPKVSFPIDLESYSEGSEDFMPLSGMISVIQERGAKARVVAMTHASAQVALYPLHRVLDEMLKNISSDCTHNQESGAQWAHQKLMEGEKVYSVDLSGATDNFPLSLQLGVLNGLGFFDEANLIRTLSKGQWMLSKPLIEEARKLGFYDAVSYTNGQPQGLYSSFPLFALSHNLLVGHLAERIGISKDDSFRILGDDIVMCNEELHTEYRRVMMEFGVPISEDKSLQSDKLAEFAGFVISKDGYWKPAKVPNPSADGFGYDNNFVTYLRVVGYAGLKYLPSKVRKVATKVAELPEDLGGLGLNPRGLSYEDRIKTFITTSAQDKIPRYLGMETLFTKLRFSNRHFDAEEETILDWLYDQYNLISQRALLPLKASKLASLANAGITNPNELAYQFSALFNIADVADMATMKGNVASATHPTYVTEFQLWSRRFASFDIEPPVDGGTGNKNVGTKAPSLLPPM